MKKILFVVLIMAMLFAFAACGDTSAPSTDPNAADPADTGDAANVLIMATEGTFPPYEFYENEKLVGIDVEIAGLIAEKLGMEIKVEDIAFDSIIPAVQSGRAQMGMAGMTVTEDRLEDINFTDSYATGVLVAVVREDSEIVDVDNLFAPGGYTIGAQTGTTGELYATWDIEDEDLGTVERYKSYSDAIQALKSGRIDCVIVDSEPAKAYVAANEGLKILDSEFSVEDYAICIAKDNDELLEKVNKALNELIEDGSVQKIIDKYITE